MNTYKIKVTSEYFIDNFTVEAENLSEASEKAKSKFRIKYKYFKDLKTSISPQDVINHIEEIILCLSK